MDDALRSLRQIDFDWIRQIDSVWEPNPFHVKGLHQPIIDELLDEMDRLVMSKRSESPLGAVVVGYPGAGKTHLLGVLSQQLQGNAFFVMVDMTDVTDFWSTLRLGYLDSLYRSLHGKAQYHSVLEHLLSMISGVVSPEKTRIGLARLEEPAKLVGYINKILLGPLWEKYPREIQKYRDVLKALFLLNSRAFETSTTGYSWLQGITLETEARKQYGFASAEADPTLVVEGLSWAMSLARPTLLAFDQLDAIVAQHYRESGEFQNDDELQGLEDRIGEHDISENILHEVAGGLMDIQGLSFRTLSLVSCLHRTWELLQERGVRSFSDRYRLPPHILAPLKSADIGRQIIRQRVLNSLPGFTPPDEDWPLVAGVFDHMPRLMPRELLKLCDASRRKILAKGRFQRLDPFESAFTRIPELTAEHELSHPSAEATESGATEQADSSANGSSTFSPSGMDRNSAAAEQINIRIDQAYEELQQVADIVSLFSEHKEDSLIDEVIQAVCRCLVWENPQPDQQHVEVDDDFGNPRQSKVLHARVRLIPANASAREEHFAFRALQQSNPKAFQSRLSAALIASGLDERFSFRRLVIIRDMPLPLNRTCERAWHDFQDRGGIWISPTEDAWRKMYALSELERAIPPGFEDWLDSRKPASSLSLFTECGLTRLIHGDSLNLDVHEEVAVAAEAESADSDSSTGQNNIVVLDTGFSIEAEHLEEDDEDDAGTDSVASDSEGIPFLEIVNEEDVEETHVEEKRIEPAKVEQGRSDETEEASSADSGSELDPFDISTHWPVGDGDSPVSDFSGLTLDASNDSSSSDLTGADSSGRMDAQPVDDTPAEDPMSRTSLPMSPFNGFMGGQVVRSFAGIDVRRALLIGRRPERSGSTDFVALPIADLNRHTLILGSAGAGKTMVLRRLVEEATLAGIPSIVLDSSCELACLGQRQTDPVQAEMSWPDDVQRAKAYMDRLEYRLWTPGFDRGRSLNLGYGINGLSFKSRPKEEQRAVALLVESLRPLVAPRSAPDAAELDLLADAIRYQSQQGETGLDELIHTLAHLPAELRDTFVHAQELGTGMASRLKAALDIRPELDTRENQLSMRDLLQSEPGKTRVSVINLMGLASVDSRARLLIQLAVSMVSWGYGRISAGTHTEGFRALLVIDDAESLVNESPMGLVALKYLLQRAGRFGVGVVLSTQNPAYLSDNMVSLFGNTLFGRANSPLLVDTIQRQIRLKGSIGHDVPWLEKGEFYAHSPGFQESVRIQAPICLSRSGYAMTEKELVALAAVNSSIDPRDRQSPDLLGIEF